MNRVFTRMLLVVWCVAMLARLASPWIFPGAESANRDKSGTTRGFETANDSQVALNKTLASRVSFAAEGTGFEPATPCGAPHFECGC